LSAASASVDTAPHSEAAAVSAAAEADLGVIPVRPSILDLRAVRATVDIAAHLGWQAAFVLNSCPAGCGVAEAAIVMEARKALVAYGLPVAPQTIVQRAALAHALIDGLAVHEFAPEGKAASEMRGLWHWLKDTMRNGEGWQPDDRACGAARIRSGEPASPAAEPTAPVGPAAARRLQGAVVEALGVRLGRPLGSVPQGSIGRGGSPTAPSRQIPAMQKKGWPPG
jgi:hypothetical protein